MSGYDGNYGEHDARDLYEWGAYERDLEHEEREQEQEQETDRLRRDWPVRRPKKAAT